jgi:hypothetical protein
MTSQPRCPKAREVEIVLPRPVIWASWCYLVAGWIPAIIGMGMLRGALYGPNGASEADLAAPFGLSLSIMLWYAWLNKRAHSRLLGDPDASSDVVIDWSSVPLIFLVTPTWSRDPGQVARSLGVLFSLAFPLTLFIFALTDAASYLEEPSPAPETSLQFAVGGVWLASVSAVFSALYALSSMAIRRSAGVHVCAKPKGTA